jgi:hypothetical protein
MSQTDDAPRTEDAPKEPRYKFSWWCKQCGWWSEVDLSGLCSVCRNESDRKGRGATPDDVARLGRCRSCDI